MYFRAAECLPIKHPFRVYHWTLHRVYSLNKLNQFKRAIYFSVPCRYRDFQLAAEHNGSVGKAPRVPQKTGGGWTWSAQGRGNVFDERYARNGRKEEGLIRTIRRAFFGRVLGNLRYEGALQLAVSSEAAFLQSFFVGPTHHSPLFRGFLSVLSLSINWAPVERLQRGSSRRMVSEKTSEFQAARRLTSFSHSPSLRCISRCAVFLFLRARLQLFRRTRGQPVIKGPLTIRLR